MKPHTRSIARILHTFADLLCNFIFGEHVFSVSAPQCVKMRPCCEQLVAISSWFDLKFSHPNSLIFLNTSSGRLVCCPSAAVTAI